MSASERAGRHFRGKPRPGRRLDVAFRVGDGDPVAAHTRNVGIGGAFVVTDSSPPVGTAIILSIALPGGAPPIEVKAEVRWHAQGAGEDRGMGLKFYGLEVDELLQLDEYFASLTGTEGPDPAE
jgi:uncharacterized protein (TIGR02266 family)